MTSDAGPPSSSHLDLSHLPPIFVLSVHSSCEELHRIEEALVDANALLTYDISEATLILGNLHSVKRAKLELVWKNINLNFVVDDVDWSIERLKRLEHEIHADDVVFKSDRQNGVVLVLRIQWLWDSRNAQEPLDMSNYTLIKGYRDATFLNSTPITQPTTHMGNSSHSSDAALAVLERAARDGEQKRSAWSRKEQITEAAQRDFGGKAFAPVGVVKRTMSSQPRSQLSSANRNVHRIDTEEHEQSQHLTMPALPDWIVNKQIYACQRSTAYPCPNAEFITQLKEIRLARLLLQDEIGVRAYSTSIAALSAYPYPLKTVAELLRLPGCEQKIAVLFRNYQNEGVPIDAVKELRFNPALKILREFYDIWGVGAATAREFYYDRGWQTLDDIVEFGWGSLNRVQQIGLKYYEELQVPIPRREVEEIAGIVHKHARLVAGDGIQSIIVGGYRRGKAVSGDVDIILSHPEHEVTRELVDKVILSLEREGWITHTLSLQHTNSKRDQHPVRMKGLGETSGGFDTLDKALVVWQDFRWPDKEQDLAADSKAKNPLPHRRVDIIISPWRTIGCAVAGWTSGTTFQRDLRRYVKVTRGLKFDSSGVRDRASGAWVDLEGWQNPETRCTDWKEAERRVFEGLGLVYRPPEERCTG